ncbi:MAG: NAD-dependent epimerase/dehydratase family protein [Alphaproteobacteria bacterium]|nr:NAD-dependent epimerase/dehydratase family protein [Alphaproteobacteria bacterium]
MKIFLTGATGLIGGTIAAKLLAAGHSVRGLVRDSERGALLAKKGIEPVVGTLDHLDTLSSEARAADATLNTANADNPFAADAIVNALKGSGKTLIHTSGSTIVGDHSAGEYPSATYHEDLRRPIPLPEKCSRIATDTLVCASATEGVRSMVLCPTLVYGTGLGVRTVGPQVMNFVKLAQERGQPCHIGAGKNIWSHIHVEDCADAYLLALEKAQPGAYYFLTNGEASWVEMAQAIGRLLGLGEKTGTIRNVDAVRRWGAPFAHAMGGNSRLSSAKAKAELGWKPHRKSILHDIEFGSFRQALAAG